MAALGALANLAGAGVMLKSELKVASSELNAGKGKLQENVIANKPLSKIDRRKALAEKYFTGTGKSGADLNDLMETVDFSRAVKETVLNVGDKVYRFEKFNSKGGTEKHFFTDAYGADAGPTGVGFKSPEGYRLVTYEVTQKTTVMESSIRNKKGNKQYFSTELQNNIKKISEE